MNLDKKRGLLSIFQKDKTATAAISETANPASGLPGLWTPPPDPAPRHVSGTGASPGMVPGLWMQAAAASISASGDVSTKRVAEAPASQGITFPGAWVPPPAAVMAPEAERMRLVFAVDATASREQAWKTAKKLTDRLLKALPGELDVALAVHGGGRVHTFTDFTSEANRLRDKAAGVRCQAGGTRLLEILARVLKLERVRVVLYIGDCFEESKKEARKIADALLKQETRVIILHDGWRPPGAFGEIAERSGGALLRFDGTALEQLGELLEAVAALAVGGVEMVEQKQATLPAASVLLQNLDPQRLLLGHQ